MRKATATALVLMSAVLAFGAPQQQQQKSDWVKYNSDEGRYSALFPNQPEVSSQETTSSTNEKVTQHLATSADQGTAYLIGYFDKSGMTFSFDKARDGMLAKIKGTLLAEKAISLGGHPGREVKVAAKGSDDADYIALARYYDVKDRIYVVEVVFPKASEGSLSGNTAKFFDSFAVVTPQ
ncbi:MAG: hypothetical protein M3O85_08905 [Acidobacteriota bacterium]|nr:hypothetical protein [Acidobacteriota bacterium]